MCAPGARVERRQEIVVRDSARELVTQNERMVLLFVATGLMDTEIGCNCLTGC